jgi:hypothetical protein
MEYRTSQNRARHDIPTRPEARHDTVTRDLAMSKYPLPRNFTARFMFCRKAAFLVSRASLRACASQIPDYDKGTSAGAIWACRLSNGGQVIDTFCTLHGYRPFYNTIFHSNECCISRMRILRRAKCNNDIYSLSYFKAFIDAFSCYVT